MKLDITGIRPHSDMGFAIIEMDYLGRSPTFPDQFEDCSIKVFVAYAEGDTIAELSSRGLERARLLMSTT